MKKIIILSLLLILTFALLLTGCDEGEEKPEKGGAFVGGKEGIVASFEPLSAKDPDTGIYTIFDTEDFSLDITLKNKGEEDVPPEGATLRLLGPPSQNFENVPNWILNNQQTIEKVSEFNPPGGEEIVTFSPEANAKYTGKVTGFTDINWNLEYWYKYKTHLIIDDVCFKGNLNDPKVCIVKEAKVFSVSGAPITITKVEEDVAGKGLILLRIEVENKGVGDATIVGQDFDYRFSQVAYNIETPEKWECKSGGRQNEARLVEGKAQIICRSLGELGEDELYTTSVRLTLDYLYKDIIKEKLRIKESLK